MSLSINTKTYVGDNFAPDAVGYKGPAHTLSVTDFLLLGRVLPKPTTTFSGVGRTQAKLTRTLTLTGALTPTGQAINTINHSIPVGASGTDIDAMLDDMGAFLASADYKTYVKQQLISY
jgi:hypothetical protein